MKLGKGSMKGGNDFFAQSGKGRKLVMLIEDKEVRKKFMWKGGKPPRGTVGGAVSF